ncbi:uncharacterized protein RSE6_04577 [Rhynchosporium secalis]|uniref:C2H2-type domain-containing protein n=1 Tax=Rhynchosporium secalis TaxID=38038 RepID=A0A1E1M5N3_RHYSE|nr:uncharacterized protein RSE6_04577 [Rhynchosporium secalis]
MASNRPRNESRDGSTRRKKRMMSNEGEKQGSAKKPAKKSSWFGSSTAAVYNSSEDEGEATPSPEPPTAQQREEYHRRIARIVDENYEVLNAKRLLAEMDETNDPFDPDILPNHLKWIAKRTEVVTLLQDPLQSINLVLKTFDIDENNFKALLLFPPRTDDIVLAIQKEHTYLYYAAMGPGGAFEGVNDNLATKITMLYFGLPIEPLTYHNVINCELDQNDSPDDEPEAPRVQRIIYSEKALEFLDSYHERSFGFPMLRRPKPIMHIAGQPVPVGPEPDSGGDDSDESNETDEIDDTDKGDHLLRGLKPLRPMGDALGIRGGGGIPSDRFLYTHYGANIRLDAIDGTVSADEFKAAVLKALDLDPNSDWFIVVDQYDNSDRAKDNPLKTFVASFNMTSSEFDAKYERVLKARISNPLQNWALSVDYLRTKAFKAPMHFSIPPRKSDGRDTIDLTQLPQGRPPKYTAKRLPRGNRLFPTPVEKGTRNLYTLPSASSLPIKDDIDSFIMAIQKLSLSFVARNVSISMYFLELDDPPKDPISRLDHTILFPSTGDVSKHRVIRDMVFGPEPWTAVMHETLVMPPVLWPPFSTMAQVQSPPPKQILTTAPLYRHGRGVYVNPTASDFKKQALALLGSQSPEKYDFIVDLYHNQPDRKRGPSRFLDFSNNLRFTPESLPRRFSKNIQPLLFRGEADWALVVRLASEEELEVFDPSSIVLSTVPSAPVGTPPATKYTSSAQPRNTTTTIPPANPDFGPDEYYIYGYAGQVKVDRTLESFQAGALALLGLTNSSDWTFTVDLHNSRPVKSINVSADTIAAQFQMIKDVPSNHGKYYVPGYPPLPWPVFVRKSTRVSTQNLTPPRSGQNYVKLGGPVITSYWKLPTPVDGRYGINQIQDSFYSAMLVHYPLGTLRPAQDINLMTGLGFGGIELNEEFWTSIVKSVQAAPGGVIGISDVPEGSKSLEKEIGVRIAGSPRYQTFERKDFESLARAIRQLSEVEVSHKPQNLTSTAPTSFKAWFQPEDRENASNGCEFYYDDYDNTTASGKNLTESLRNWFRMEEEGKYTNCIWFRPEWKKFTIIDNTPTDDGGMQIERANEEWDVVSHSKTLESFRAMLGILWDDDTPGLTENFEIHVPQGDQRFVIDDQTTEDQWRKHVFDYFHDNTLIVQPNNGIPCVRDISDPWGIVDMPLIEKKVTFAPETYSPTQPRPTSVERDHGNSHHYHQDGMFHHHEEPFDKTESRQQRNTNKGHPPHVTQPSHQPRRIPGAKPPTFKTSDVPKWDKWMLNHTAQNNLQQRSWAQDQSVIEPGYAPAAPLYGDNLELAISVGPSMPTVFVQHLTPTDIIELRKENRKLLNHALEREIGCPICNMTFKAYDNDAKSAHYQTHMEQINSAGNCPICNENWALFTWSQKRDHLHADFAKKGSQDIRQFWDDIKCPICNLDFAGKTAESVTTHMASHVPGALKFCDRCGLDLLRCSPIERDHHDQVCTRDTPVRPAGAPDSILCQFCGRERTPESEKNREHTVCGNGQHCIRCGLNLSLLGGPQEQHSHSTRCRVPGGTTGKYCRRCGKNLQSLTFLDKTAHHDDCYRREPGSVAADGSPEIGYPQNVTSQRAQIDREREDLRNRQNELKAQETSILAREQDILRRERGHSRSDSSSQYSHGLTGTATCPICLGDLSTCHRGEIVDHFQQHSETNGDDVNTSTVSHNYHSDALNASLAEFRRRLPDFRAASDQLQQFVEKTTVSATQVSNLASSIAAEEKNRNEPERLAIVKDDRRLGAKKALEENFAKRSQEAIRSRDSEIFELRVQLAVAKKTHPIITGGRISEIVIEAQRKLSVGETDLARVKELEKERAARWAIELGRMGAEIAARKIKIGFVPDPANDPPVNSGTDGGNDSGGGPSGSGGGGSGGQPSGGGGGGGGGGDNPDDDVDQTGFMPSPDRQSFKKLPSLRRTRSVKGRAPTTGSKRKKAAMDDSEDTMSGGFSNLVRSPSKRETKKMRTGMVGSSPRLMRRRMVIAEEGEGDEEISEFISEETGTELGSVSRRATRAMGGTPSVGVGMSAAPMARRVGRQRNVVQEENIDDDGFEDVEEGDEEDGDEMVQKGTSKRARK